MKALSESRWLRFGVLTAFYFAQGVPIGLISVALPSRLTEQGRSVEEIAAFTAVVTFPWAIKLIMGPFMDRFTYLAMGFRRPWVLASQTGLVLSFLGFAFLGELSEQSLLPLMVLGFITNFFSATQDVAVDGMAIDVLPVDERGRANAFMAFGQRIGWSIFGAVTGTLLVYFGLFAAGMACAVMVFVILVLGIVVLERPGEKHLPWSRADGGMTNVGKRRTGDDESLPLSSYFANLARTLVLPMSMLLIFIEFLNRVRDGFALTIQPVFAVQEFGITTDVYTQFYGVVDVVAALIGVCLGPFIDRVGARWVLFVALIASSALHLAVGLLPTWWQEPNFVIPMAVAVAIASQVIFIAIIAMFMNICHVRIAATQFAVYMSLANLSRTVGSTILATVGEYLSMSEEFLVMGLLLLGAAVGLVMFRETAHHSRMEALQL